MEKLLSKKDKKIMQKIIAFIVLLLAASNTIIAQSTKTNAPINHRMVAEYEPTEALWLLYPQVSHKQGFSNPQVLMNIINAIAPDTKIKLVVPTDSVKQMALQQITDSLLQSKAVDILMLPYHEFWCRDMGPRFVKNNTTGQLLVPDFKFNAWGYADTTDAVVKLDEGLDRAIAAQLNLTTLPSSMITEGGNQDANSQGVMLAVQTVEKDRNPNMTHTQIDAEFKRVLGVKKIVWLQQGLTDDDKSTSPPLLGNNGKRYYTLLTTNGHVDEVARFVNDSTILLAYIPPAERKNPIEKETGKRMDANFKILSTAVGLNGKPFNIIKLPLPYLVTSTLQPGDGVYDILSTLQFTKGHQFPKGKTINVLAAASYLNFVIVNNKVLIPAYWKEGFSAKIKARDEAAMKIFKSVFPNKKLIALDALAINFGGGGMHCISMNQPATSTHLP
jgi:agmatine deiminase